MKTTRILSLAITMAMGMITGLQASVTEHQPPAPLPEFKSPEQLAKWRAETTAKTANLESASARLSTSDSSTPFYTGKPYLAESGSYAFKYREYNPEMGRWTTVDPSGFPDGANNRMYAAVPTSQMDDNGLYITLLYKQPYSFSFTVSTLSYASLGINTVEAGITGAAVGSYLTKTTQGAVAAGAIGAAVGAYATYENARQAAESSLNTSYTTGSTFGGNDTASPGDPIYAQYNDKTNPNPISEKTTIDRTDLQSSWGAFSVAFVATINYSTVYTYE
jgi:RHS repeat-associated protein